jgi:NTE family protein
MMAGHPPQVTLALAGGGAKCAAEAGALAVLEAAGLGIGGLVGVSGGGLVAVLYALGWQPKAICDYIAQTHLLELWNPDPSRRALMGLRKSRARLTAAVGDLTFGDLAQPVVLVAADLDTGQEVHLASGRLDEALMATMAIPGLFAPVRLNGRPLIDGGVLNPLPVDVARQWGRPVVAIDVLTNSLADGPGPQLFEAQGPVGYVASLGQRLGLIGVLEVVNQAVLIATARIRDHTLLAYPPDVLIRPQVANVGLLAFDLAAYAFGQGEAAAQAALPALARLAYHPQLAG